MFRRQVQSIFAFLLAVFMLVSASQSAEATDHWITLHNNTGRTIHKLYWYASGYNPGSGISSIPNGYTMKIGVNSDYRYWDVKLYWDNTNYTIWQNTPIGTARNIYFVRNSNGSYRMNWDFWWILIVFSALISRRGIDERFFCSEKFSCMKVW